MVFSDVQSYGTDFHVGSFRDGLRRSLISTIEKWTDSWKIECQRPGIQTLLFLMACPALLAIFSSMMLPDFNWACHVRILTCCNNYQCWKNLWLRIMWLVFAGSLSATHLHDVDLIHLFLPESWSALQEMNDNVWLWSCGACLLLNMMPCKRRWWEVVGPKEISFVNHIDDIFFWSRVWCCVF